MNVSSKDITNYQEAQEFLVKLVEEKCLLRDGYQFTKSVKWGPDGQANIFDILVQRHKFILAVFNIVQQQSYLNAVKETFSKYVFSNTTAYLVFFYCVEKGGFTYCSRPEHFINSKKLKFYSLSNFEKVYQKIEVFGKKISETDWGNIQHDDESNYGLKFYKKTEQSLDPDWCREQLGDVGCDKICRYSSLESLFCTLKYKTIRMNGLPGMNDKGEGLFAWNMVLPPDMSSSEENARRLREINNTFIVSFSDESKIDNLTQWRTYGVDSKGVCCVYSIQKEKIKDRFFLHKVRYIPKTDDNNIQDQLLQNFKNHGTKVSVLSYYDLSPAIFFYKPESFDIEEEVRLLVDNKKTSAYNSPQYKREWLLTNANNIPNPYIDVPLIDVPLKLERIYLGSNISDIDVIQIQLEIMLKQQGFDVEVVRSNKDEYRSSN